MRFKERHQASRTVISYVESEKSGHCEAHQEHQPVCEIQIKKSTVVRDARLHGTFYILMGQTTDAAVRANPPRVWEKRSSRSGDATSGCLRQGRLRHCAHGRFAAVGQLWICPRSLPALQIGRVGVGRWNNRKQSIALEGAVYFGRGVLGRCRNRRDLQAGHQSQHRESQTAAEKIRTMWTHEIAPPVRRCDRANGSKPKPVFLDCVSTGRMMAG